MNPEGQGRLTGFIWLNESIQSQLKGLVDDTNSHNNT